METILDLVLLFIPNPNSILPPFSLGPQAHPTVACAGECVCGVTFYVQIRSMLLTAGEQAVHCLVFALLAFPVRTSACVQNFSGTEKHISSTTAQADTYVNFKRHFQVS